MKPFHKDNSLIKSVLQISPEFPVQLIAFSAETLLSMLASSFSDGLFLTCWLWLLQLHILTGRHLAVTECQEIQHFSHLDSLPFSCLGLGAVTGQSEGSDTPGASCFWGGCAWSIWGRPVTPGWAPAPRCRGPLSSVWKTIVHCVHVMWLCWNTAFLCA